MNYRQKSGYTVKSKQAIQTPPRQRLPILVAVISTFGVAAMQPDQAQAATYAWKNVTGDWTVGANWASGIVPGAGDVAIFSAGGEAQLSALATIFGLTQSYGTISGTGNLTVTDTSTLTGGTHTGSGKTILQGTTTIGGSIDLDGGRELRNENALTWNSGYLDLNGNNAAGSGSINNITGATFTVSGDNSYYIYATNRGGTDTGADAVFNNAGTFRKSGSGVNNTTAVDVAFNNTGSVDVQTGILSLTNGSTHTGNFNVAAGAVLNFGAGTHNLNGGSITSPGTVRVYGGGNVNVNTAYSIAGTTDVQYGTFNILNGDSTTGSLKHSGGTIAGSKNLTVTGTSTLTGGTHTGSGKTILQGTTTIGGSIDLDGGRELRNENALTWNSGYLDLNGNNAAGSGSINNITGATFTVSGDNSYYIYATNRGGTDTGADAVFNNAGTFRKSGSGVNNTTAVDVAFNNTGSVDVQTGILSLTNGSTHTGNFNVAAGAVLNFGAGTHNLNGGSITSPGTVRVYGGGNVNVNTAYSIAGTTDVQYGTFNILNGDSTTGSLKHSGGTIAGSKNLTVTGTSTLTGGTHTGSGKTILQGTTTIGGSIDLDGGRELRNENALTWNSGYLDLNGNNAAGSGSINNITGATFTVSGDNSYYIYATNRGGTDTGADAVFNNAGTFRKSGSGVNNTTAVDVAFNNTGSVDVQTGVLNFTQPFTNQGTINVASNAVVKVQDTTFINQGTLQGNGKYQTYTATTALINTGIVAPGVGGVGALTVAGDFTQTAAGFFNIDLASLTSFDTLSVLGDGSLSGALKISSLGGYNPNIGDSFIIATFDDGVVDASDLMGTFNSINWTGFGSGVAFTATYDASSVKLNVTAVPEPVSAWLLSSGLVFVFAAARRRRSEV